MNNRRVWIEGETRAENYLKKSGYKIIDKNYKIGGSEIDIIVKLPKNIQKKQLILEFKDFIKTNNLDKREFKFHKNILKNNIKNLNDILVFVEVKARFSKKFGYPFEAVDEKKKHNIERGCVAYLKKINKTNVNARIDVISVIDDEIVHIENAFELKMY